MMHSLKAQAEIRMVYENQLFNGKNFHVFIYITKQKASVGCISMIIMNLLLF